MLVIFAKEPTPGQVKTRLCPPLSLQAAARLYAAFLRDVVTAMARLGDLPLALAYTPASARAYFEALAPVGTLLVPQSGVDLGERLEQAFAWAFEQEAGPVMIRNSDSPDLPPAYILEAKEILVRGQAEVVLGPCPDGGYYLVGLCSPQPHLFRDIPWSGAAVLAATQQRAAALRLATHLLPPWPDIDTFEDLLHFLERPRTPAEPGWRSHGVAQELLAGELAGRKP